jgi:hypothetical protein
MGVGLAHLFGALVHRPFDLSEFALAYSPLHSFAIPTICFGTTCTTTCPVQEVCLFSVFANVSLLAVVA